MRLPKSAAALAASSALLFFAPARALAAEVRIIEPSPWMTAPFIILLLAIALMPFIHRHWWERYYPHVSIALGAVVVVYYLLILGNGVRMMHTGFEFVSFLCLIGSLFVVAGGIHISLRGYSTPVTNVLLLAFGAVLSNIVGTTGASMILIRPWIRNNKYRMHPYLIIFFIFLVSNIGGALTPIGDPPLFLGYLKGIPFFWVMENVWHVWILVLAILLGAFAAIDSHYYRKVPSAVRAQLHAQGEKARIDGLHNVAFLAVILGAVFIQRPPFVREALMVAAAVASTLTTRRDIHEANDFSWAPIKEVGFLFLGLFATMVPALDWLELHAVQLGISTPAQFYWSTGVLSSFLDNAPTYLNFLSAAIGLLVPPEAVQQLQAFFAHTGVPAAVAALPQQLHAVADALRHYHGNLIASGTVPVQDVQTIYLITLHPLFVVAISLSAVFFGAATYIGNAPNFMVKSIAEQFGVKMPSFFGYIARYTLPILLPVLVVVWMLFL